MEPKACVYFIFKKSILPNAQFQGIESYIIFSVEICQTLSSKVYLTKRYSKIDHHLPFYAVK